MNAPRAFGRITAVAVVILAAAAALGTAAAQAQGPYAPIILDSFESPAGVSPWSAVTASPEWRDIYVDHAASTLGATQGSQSLLLEVEGEDFDCETCFDGYLSGSALKRQYFPSDAQYAALTAALADPQGWNLELDVTTTAASWTAAPPAAGFTASRVRVGIGLRDGGQPGSPYFSGALTLPNLYGTIGTSRLSTPLNAALGGGAIPTNPSSFALVLGGLNTFAASDPESGAVLYFDNIRLRRNYPELNEVVWDFESDAATFQGWSDAGNGGIYTAHKHHIVTGLGATNVTIYGGVTPAPAGHALLIDTSNIPPASNGFQWGSAMTLNADVNNDGAIDDPAAKTKMNNLVALMRRSHGVQFDVTFHDALAPPAGLPPAQEVGETNASWLKIVLGVWTDPTPANGVANGPLSQFQYDNEWAVDALRQDVQISRSDYAAVLTSEPSPNGFVPDEPLTMTMPFAGMGNLASVLQSNVFDDSNFLRFSFAVQTGTGTNTILASIDNIRFVSRVPLDADFDFDGDVDGDDLTEWHDKFGDLTGADANGDVDVDGDDFLVWQRQLGNSLPEAPGAAAVPEPSTLLVALATTLIVLSSRACRR